jgi:nicotinamidase-related amidase
MASPTLRELTRMNPNPSPISESALVLIDCQQTYREGIMQLVGVEPALKEAASLLKCFRAAGRPVIHIMHDAGPGTPYDVKAPIGQIADIVAPIEGETVVVKNYPS